MTATVTSPTPLEIEFVPDVLGVAFVRDLLDAIEARMTDAARDPCTVIERPLGMPDRLDPEPIADLAGAIEQAGVVLGGPEAEGLLPRSVFSVPASRRSRFRRLQEA